METHKIISFGTHLEANFLKAHENWFQKASAFTK